MKLYVRYERKSAFHSHLESRVKSWTRVPSRKYGGHTRLSIERDPELIGKKNFFLIKKALNRAEGEKDGFCPTGGWEGPGCSCGPTGPCATSGSPASLLFNMFVRKSSSDCVNECELGLGEDGKESPEPAHSAITKWLIKNCRSTGHSKTSISRSSNEERKVFAQRYAAGSDYRFERRSLSRFKSSWIDFPLTTYHRGTSLYLLLGLLVR